MIERPFWIQKINDAWDKRPIVWLSGVRRVGKTTLAQMFPDAIYMNCDLPSVNRSLSDPEFFFDGLEQGITLILDEVHRLEDPSRVLKIAADEYGHLRVLATGSSTLSATRKFQDSLTGRKITLYLPPVLWTECSDYFGITSLDHRFLHGGLPEPLLSNTKDTNFFSEWMDSFYARDIQELFNIRNRSGFMKLLHLILRQSGDLLEYTNLAKLSGVSRPTVKSHIEAMSIAHALLLLPPFHGGGRREIISRPKCYAFDTGFITFVKGWDSIREDDRGLLWEHIVLDALRTVIDDFYLFYWRDKSGREIDFVIKSSGRTFDVIECKINPDYFNSRNLVEFRVIYPKGRNFVVSPMIKSPYQMKHDDLIVQYNSINQLPWFSMQQ